MADIKVPPHSRDAERSLLGAMLLSSQSVVDVIDLVVGDMFYEASHGMIFESIKSLYQDRSPIDVVTVGDGLKKSKHLKKIGGASYLAELVAEVPTAAHALKYAEIVKEKFVKRQMINLAAEMNEMALDDVGAISEVLDKAERGVFALSQSNVRRGFVPIKEALADSFDRLDELHKAKDGLRGIPTGFSDLDGALAGLQDSNLLILAARPGVGKTTLAMNIAQYVSVEQKIPVGVFSLEMSNLELVDRMLVAQANIDAWKMKTGNLNNDEFMALSEAMGVLADAPLFIDDKPGQTILEMRTKARRLQAEVGVKLIIMDYLQLAVGDGRYDSRTQEVSAISQGLKNLARELRVPVLALSQLNRAVESRGDKVPQLADLRESGSIEQDSDVVMFLYKPDSENMENCQLKIAKHRNGPTKTIDLKFRGDRIKFFGVNKRGN